MQGYPSQDDQLVFEFESVLTDFGCLSFMIFLLNLWLSKFQAMN